VSLLFTQALPSIVLRLLTSGLHRSFLFGTHFAHTLYSHLISACASHNRICFVFTLSLTLPGSIFPFCTPNDFQQSLLTLILVLHSVLFENTHISLTSYVSRVRTAFTMMATVKCTYESCDQWFPSEREMQLHKYIDEKHDYCRRCDYDGTSWDDLLQHKIDAMAPYLFELKKLEREDKKKGKKIMHVVCEFCGEEFKTWSGRDKHRTQVSQSLLVLRLHGPRKGR